MSAVSVSEPGVRPILAGAVDLARRALLELQPEGVGEHLGVTAEDEYAATHHFATTLPGYRGWQWAVVVAAAPEAERVTVSESALLPGPDALVAPDFVPWERRVRPGDLAPGDLLAPLPDDPRLVPGYLVTGDPVVDDVCEELGQGRPQVLSREGREEAADRWFTEYGPDTEMARAAPSTCRLCGFYVPLAGALRASYGVCANALGADGHVVHAEYGCGAHSDTELPTGNGSPLYEAYDDAAVELISPEDLRKPSGDTPTATSDVTETSEPTNPTAPADAVAQESVVESPDTVVSQDVSGSASADAPGAITASDAASPGTAVVSAEVAAHEPLTSSSDTVVRQDVSFADAAVRETAESADMDVRHDVSESLAVSAHEHADVAPRGAAVGSADVVARESADAVARHEDSATNSEDAKSADAGAVARGNADADTVAEESAAVAGNAGAAVRSTPASADVSAVGTSGGVANLDAASVDDVALTDAGIAGSDAGAAGADAGTAGATEAFAAESGTPAGESVESGAFGKAAGSADPLGTTSAARPSEHVTAVSAESGSAEASATAGSSSVNEPGGESRTTSPGLESTTDFAAAVNPAVAAEESDRASAAAASTDDPRGSAIAAGPSAQDIPATAPVSEEFVPADVPDFGTHVADADPEPSTSEDSSESAAAVEPSAVQNVSADDAAASPAEYHDAWAVSAVRVRHGAEGATGASGAS